MTTQNSTNHFPGSVSFRVLFMLMIQLSIVATAMAGQRSPDKFYENFGVRLSATVSANRFGVIYCPSVFYKHNKHVFSLGTGIQKQNFNLSGAEFNYEYTLMDGSKHYGSKISCLELFTFGSVAYHNKAFLGKAACEEEKLTNTERPVDLSRTKFEALDVYAGFGMRVSFLHNFKWFNCIGVGGYSVFNAPGNLYYNNRSLGLMMRSGITYQFVSPTRVNY